VRNDILSEIHGQQDLLVVLQIAVEDVGVSRPVEVGTALGHLAGGIHGYVPTLCVEGHAAQKAVS